MKTLERILDAGFWVAAFAVSVFIWTADPHITEAERTEAFNEGMEYQAEIHAKYLVSECLKGK